MNKVKKKKEKNLKNKKILYVVISCFLLLGITGIGIYYYINYQQNQLLQEIQSHYHPVIAMNKNSKVYMKKNGEYQEVGMINKDFSVELEKNSIENIKQTYFKIKDTNYYVYYHDTKEGQRKKEINFDYLVFNQNVTTKKVTDFYKNGKKILKLRKNIDLPLMYMDDEYYYVSYLNEILGIKKSLSTLKEHENTKENDANYISVLHYGKIYKEGEKCTEDTCISERQLEKEMAILKEQNFYTINLEEFTKWLQGSIRLKEKAILLTLGNEFNSEMLRNTGYQMYLVTNTSSLKFQDNNHKVTKENKIDAIPRYVIKNKTSDDNYKKMLLGEEVKEVVEQTKTVNLAGNASKIAVLNYHFFYDETSEQCNQGICLSTAKFEEQLKYLKDNGWKTLTMEEFRAWMYGEIELPAKSVLLTVDDGGMGTGKSNGNKLIPLLEKYQAHATIFLITAWYFPPDYQSPYLDIESHTNEMHTEGVCSGVPRGAQMLCSTKEQVLEDLKKSINVTGSKKAFCYPFYAYNDTAVETVRESGFALGFQGGGYKATRASNKMLIPRYAIHRNITMSTFINMIS